MWWLERVNTMQFETKFLRLRTAVTIGSRFSDWRVTWGAWDRHKLYYLVMVAEFRRAVSSMNLKRRVDRLEHLGPAQGGEVLRVIVRASCGPPNLATSTCRRTLGPNNHLLN